MDDGLDLVEKADRITHDVQLNGKIDVEAGLDQYTYDTKFLQSEAAWNDGHKILGIDARRAAAEVMIQVVILRMALPRRRRQRF